MDAAIAMINDYREYEMLLRNAVYFIEEYKTKLCIIYIVAVLASLNTLIHQANHNIVSGRVARTAVFTLPNYPIINKLPVQQLSSQSQASAVSQARIPETGTQVWPMHGVVTTEFGVPHQPWQPTHTGLDISSKARSGVTPVTVFREGTVAQTLHDSGGYGNHIIVDHGDGLTSLYGHLQSINVSAGQHVTPGDILGREGSTGASTGTHLHFEIAENGHPVSPRRYFSDNP